MTSTESTPAQMFADAMLEALGRTDQAVTIVRRRFPDAEVAAGLEPGPLDQADPARLPDIVFELAYAGESFTGTFHARQPWARRSKLMSAVGEAMRAEVEDFTREARTVSDRPSRNHHSSNDLATILVGPGHRWQDVRVTLKTLTLETGDEPR